MNERILEFARQTGLCDADGDFFGGKIRQYEEFAELIVKECIDIAYREGDNVAYLALHFGVDKD